MGPARVALPDLTCESPALKREARNDRALQRTLPDQHADHQLWIDGGATHPAVKRLQRLADVIEGEMPVNAPEHMVGRDMFLKAEIIEQPRRRSFECPSSPSLPQISGIQ
jgi:hypothetical protein